MRVLKQSTARSVVVFLTDATDHVSGKAGLTLTITASKDGAAFGAITPTVTDLGSGWYKLALTTAHTDTLGDVALHITGAGADPADLVAQVVGYDFADAVRLGLSALPNAAAGAAGGLPLGDAAGKVALTSAEHTAVAADAQTGLTAQGYTSTRAGYLDTLNGLVAAIWSDLLTGITTAGSVGKLIKDYLDAAVTSRSTYAGGDTSGTTTLLGRIAGAITITGGKVDVNDKTGFSLATAPPAAAAIADAVWDEATSGHQTAGSAGAILAAVPAANDNADALLKRDWTAVSGAAGRSVLNALRALRNKVSVSGGTLTVTGEDDATPAWTADVVTDAAAEPIVSVDPA